LAPNRLPAHYKSCIDVLAKSFVTDKFARLLLVCALDLQAREVPPKVLPLSISKLIEDHSLLQYAESS